MGRDNFLHEREPEASPTNMTSGGVVDAKELGEEHGECLRWDADAPVRYPHQDLFAFKEAKKRRWGKTEKKAIARALIPVPRFSLSFFSGYAAFCARALLGVN